MCLVLESKILSCSTYFFISLSPLFQSIDESKKTKLSNRNKTQQALTPVFNGANCYRSDVG